MRKMGLKQYNSTSKKQYRRWVWNAIAERLTCGRRDAVVAYLPGPDDYDRLIAKQLGFKNENLIAIDRDPLCIANVRNGGVVFRCIHRGVWLRRDDQLRKRLQMRRKVAALKAIRTTKRNAS